MKISILGYGKVGKEIESILKQNKNKYEFGFIFDSSDSLLKKINEIENHTFIDFSTPEAFIKNLEILSQKNVNIVCGTTGWYDKLEYVKNIVEKNNIGFLYSSNFSIGVNIFWKIIENTTKYTKNLDNLDIFIREIHHNKKVDAPSGTTLKTAEKIFQNCNLKNKIFDPSLQKPINKDEISIAVSRGGEAFGIHEVFFEDDDSILKIEHKAKNRSAFAKGSILAAEWLNNKKGFFTIEDFISDIL